MTVEIYLLIHLNLTGLHFALGIHSIFTEPMFIYPFLHLYFLIVPTVDFPGMILAFATSSVGPQAEKQQNIYK